MKKVLSLILAAVMLVSLVAVFSACGDEKDTEAGTEAPVNNGTEAQTEAQTEKQTEKQTEAQTEKQTEAQTDAQTEEQTDKPDDDFVGSGGLDDPASIPDNVYWMEMNIRDTSYVDIPSMVSSIVDTWNPTTEGFEIGHTFENKDESEAADFYDAIVACGNTTTCGTTFGHTELVADKSRVYIFNGTPGDADFGHTVHANLFEAYGAYLASAYGATGNYIWLPGLWRTFDEIDMEEGFYTFVLYTDDGAMGFTEYIVQNALEDQFGKAYSFK